MDWIESKFANLITSRFSNYSRKNNNLWNFSCPFCDDNQKNKRRARGYLYESDKGRIRYHCHNCSVSYNLKSFLKLTDERLHQEFITEKLLDFKKANKPEVVVFTEKMKIPAFVKNTGLKDLQKISSLSHNHPCKKYVTDRLIPSASHHKIFYAPAFKTWVNSMLPDKFEIKIDEPRLVFPIVDRNDNMVGFQGRSLKKNNPIKYITIMLDNGAPRVYGMKDVDFNFQYYVVEGPIDSLFLNNAIATCGSDIVSELNKIQCNKENGVIVYDNEPRNPDTIKKIDRAIREGWKVVIWPWSADVKEDINTMVLRSMNVKNLIDNNIYSGLQAVLMLARWRKFSDWKINNGTQYV